MLEGVELLIEGEIFVARFPLRSLVFFKEFESKSGDSRVMVLANLGAKEVDFALTGKDKPVVQGMVDYFSGKSAQFPTQLKPGEYRVFADRNLLEALNRLVHGEVRDDIRRWYSAFINAGVKRPLFVESAIVVESGIDFMVDAIWEVVAPEKVRIARVGRRDGLDEARIRARIEAQKKNMATAHCPVATIENDGVSAVMPQVLHLLGGF